MGLPFKLLLSFIGLVSTSCLLIVLLDALDIIRVTQTKFVELVSNFFLTFALVAIAIGSISLITIPWMF